MSILFDPEDGKQDEKDRYKGKFDEVYFLGGIFPGMRTKKVTVGIEEIKEIMFVLPHEKTIFIQIKPGEGR